MASTSNKTRKTDGARTRRDMNTIEKELRKRYENQEIILCDRSLIWATERNEITLSNIPKQSGPLTNKARVKKGISLRVLYQIDAGIKTETIALISKLDNLTRKKYETPGKVGTNDQEAVSALEEIDSMLFMMTVEGLEKKLAELRKSGTDSEFFSRMLLEEKANRKRDNYVKVIEKFTPGA